MAHDSKMNFYVDQDGGPIPTVLIGFYERYREERGSSPIPEDEAICFAKYLLEHIGEFEESLSLFMVLPDPPPANEPID